MLETESVLDELSGTEVLEPFRPVGNPQCEIVGSLESDPQVRIREVRRTEVVVRRRVDLGELRLDRQRAPPGWSITTSRWGGIPRRPVG